MNVITKMEGIRKGPDELVPSRYAVRVGDIDVLVISDGVVTPPAESMATNADPAVRGAWLDDMFLSRDAFDWALNAVVVRSGGQTILIDSGIGGEVPDFPRAGPAVMGDAQILGQRAQESGELVRVPHLAAADLFDRQPERLLVQILGGGPVARPAAHEERQTFTETADQLLLRPGIAATDPPDEVCRGKLVRLSAHGGPSFHPP